MAYIPPFTITPAILDLVAEIAERVGRRIQAGESEAVLRLRRINRIRTIHGSLAIEGNTLSERQMTAILEGRRVIAPPREIQEVRNAILAYETSGRWQPASEPDLLDAHAILMAGLMERPGHYRHGGVGVMSGAEVIHMAPPASRVAVLMADLLGWLRDSDFHPLIVSCVFHYEFEFIHPFEDGNGRMGRLWQTLILSRWKPLFADLPVESLIHAHQTDYYQALADSTRQGASTPFILFMLGIVRAALATETPEQETEQADGQVTEQVRRLIVRMGAEDYSARELMALVGISHRPSFLYGYLQPALAGGWLDMTRPEAPRSPRQRYRLSQAGVKLGQRLAS